MNYFVGLPFYSCVYDLQLIIRDIESVSKYVLLLNANGAII
jgi:hypothetical protein